MTLDTNLADDLELVAAAKAAGLEVSIASVTDRELEGTSFMARAPDRVIEVFVLDESPLGTAVLGGEKEGALLEWILGVVSNGSFPARGKREALSDGERHQLRDAMILEAHERSHRDVLVTNDAKGFIDHGRRAILEDRLRTRILTKSEFLELLANGDWSAS